MSFWKSSKLSFGLLGQGYLGKRLMLAQSRSSFALGGEATTPAWDWARREEFSLIPEVALPLVLTIPPLLALPEEEQRLHEFGTWMKANRPMQNKLIYISSASVYPSQGGPYDESSETSPDSEKGRLRCLTERVLSEYFNLIAIRPGGIYGAERNLLSRIQSNKPFRSIDQVVGRIHVDDLAAITLLAIENSHFPKIINAVDPNPCSSREVLHWLQSKGVFIPKLPEEIATTGRSIHSQSLQDIIHYQWLYPSFKAGYQEILPHEPKHTL